jgi:hypothetical protein
VANAVGSSSKVLKRFRDWIKVRAVIFVAVVLALPVYFTWRAATALPYGLAWDGDDLAVDLKALSEWGLSTQTTGKDATIPGWMRDLDGKRVVLIGEIVPGRVEEDQFDLVYSITPRCSWMPRVEEFVRCKYDALRRENVKLAPGLVRAVGILKVGIERDFEDSNRILSFYRLDVESVNPS